LTVSSFSSKPSSLIPSFSSKTIIPSSSSVITPAVPVIALSSNETLGCSFLNEVSAFSSPESDDVERFKSVYDNEENKKVKVDCISYEDKKMEEVVVKCVEGQKKDNENDGHNMVENDEDDDGLMEEEETDLDEYEYDINYPEMHLFDVPIFEDEYYMYNAMLTAEDYKWLFDYPPRPIIPTKLMRVVMILVNLLIR
jgi:hypothetical protein